ncbi:hypothetical protein A3F34_00205 [Candidatus Roizmanbacteria bacterium RIFCSPHIGHO2_12_FULL_44_10]|uniref:CHRD domain-containing protein n=1 Tax=Candidatus Roizmanbacteria bacterium RIFCSPHIGHO2_12_FULL_44_10 TaxID=1802054 RepID=A0A1F7I519_9BACT|nr:MAG: hypothetical protein A3F34_00205 [Candidatus Roizmanbacteria bacterium RIFCSPHIGHO2_12_FULL_44_10]
MAQQTIPQNKMIMWVIIALIIGGIAYYVYGGQGNKYGSSGGVKETTTKEAGTATTGTEIVLAPVAGHTPSQNGTANLEEKDGKVVVTLNVAPVLDGPQPAHIHMGDCLATGDVVYPLTSLVEGKSISTLDVSMEALKAQLPLVINVHKSADEASVYTACGSL